MSDRRAATGRAFFPLLVTVVARGAEALKVGGVEEQITLAAMRPDMVSHQVAALSDLAAPNAGEERGGQAFAAQLLPLSRFVPFAPRHQFISALEPIRTRTDGRDPR